MADDIGQSDGCITLSRDSEEGQWFAIYATFGSAMSCAQRFEAALAKLLSVCKHLSDEIDVSMSDLESDAEDLRRKTLGQLLTAMSKRVSFPSAATAEKFESALSGRNFVAHRFFLERAESLSGEAGRKDAIQYLLMTSALFQSVTEHTEAMRIALSILFKLPLEGRGHEVDHGAAPIETSFRYHIAPSELPDRDILLKRASAPLTIGGD